MATSFMFMDLPVVSTTPGPEWSSLLNDALSEVVDSHDHTSGKGVPIPSAGFNIDADLDFQQWSAINLVSSQYVDQTDALSGTNLTYFLSGDLYVIDGSGRSVRITENGAISAASFGGITGLVSPASASFATDTFTWLYDTGKYALMASGPLLLRRDGETNPNRIKLTPPASLAANYDLTLPGALPGAGAFVTVSSAGQFAFSPSTSAGITSAMTAAPTTATATTTTFNVDTSNTSFQSVTGASVSITTVNSKPILVSVQTTTAGGGTISASGVGGFGQFRLLVDGSQVTLVSCSDESKQSSALGGIFSVAAGAHTITMEARVSVSGGNPTASVGACIITAVEL